MNNRVLLAVVLFFIVGVIFFVLLKTNKQEIVKEIQKIPKPSSAAALIKNPLEIDYMRAQSYPGSDIKIEQVLESGSNYRRYIGSYQSEGLKIYGLLTIPNGEKPKNGWPVIIFNHGYIPPREYRTTERYYAYQDGFASNGYVTFKADYRGHGSSEGNPEGAYYSPSYTIDVLNGLASIKKLKDPDQTNSDVIINVDKIGMWGHSMGGNITLRSMIVSKDIKVGVIWGGVVGTYDDLMNNWRRNSPNPAPSGEIAQRNRIRARMIQLYGTPKSNPIFWNSIDPNAYLQDISGPLQLDTGLADEEVPWEFSKGLNDRLTKMNKTVELYTYPGADHNISGPSFNIALQRSVDFFNKYLR